MWYIKYVVAIASVCVAASWACAADPGRVFTTERPAVVVPPPPPGAPPVAEPGAPRDANRNVPQPGVRGGAGGAAWIARPGGAAVGGVGLSMEPPPAPRKMKVTYLGVAASPANELLADQLRLGKGTGLVVDFVEEDSPAAKAGIKPHDVLLKLNDQILVNPPQLAVLVRLQKPGDKVTLTLVREAKEQKVTAELTETERMVGGGLDDFFVRPVQPGTWLKMPDPWMTEPERRAAEDARAEAARRHLEEARRLGAIAPPGAAHVSVSAAMSDGEHNLTLTITDGEKHLVAKDKDGKVVFEGPVRTDEQRAKMPPQIRKKLEKMEATTRFEVHTRFEGPDQVDEHLRGPIDEMRKHMERLNPAPAPIEPHRPEVAL